MKMIKNKMKKKKINNMNIKEYNVNTNGNNPISTNINKNIYSKTSIEKIKENVEKII